MRLLRFILPAMALFCQVSSMGALDRQWTVYLIHHTHTDIGYTRPQAEILSEHMRYLDYVLDYCDMTDSYPDDSKFRWTCESAWVVARYIQTRPKAQVRRLLSRISEGRIEVTAMAVNMAETADENTLRHSLESLRVLQENGIRPLVAMQDDVNGMAWCFADWFPVLGVRYLWMGEHAHKAIVPFDKPSIFRWEAPSGEGMTAFRGEHYMTGNFWGIETLDADRFASSAESYLKSLEDRHYQFDAVAIQYSGAYTDNAPPSVRICDFIRDWNATHNNPKLRSAVASEFPSYIESKYPDLIRTFQDAWPDWWTDGLASAPRETAVARKTQAELVKVQGLLSMAALSSAAPPIEVNRTVSGVQEDLLFYNEHTFGASESVSDPLCWNSQIQWMGKSSYVWNAERSTGLLREHAAALLQSRIPHSNVPVLAVFNPLAWTRGAYADVFLDYELVPYDKPFSLEDDSGNSLRKQTVSWRNEGRVIRFYAADVPSMGYKLFQIRTDTGSFPEAPALQGETSVLENDYYRVDTRDGSISIFDKRTGVDLFSHDSPYVAGDLIFETLEDRWQLARLNGEGLRRSGMSDISFSPGVDGEVYSSIVMHGSSPACDERGVRCEIRLYKDSPKVEFAYNMRRLRQTEATSVYVSFPFEGDGNSLRFNVQGGEVQPGVNQLEGTSTEWNTVQDYVAVRRPDVSGQILLVSPEVPLVQLGSLLDGPFQYIKEYDKPYVYSWVMNNYWTTNFKAEQEGEFFWTYDVISVADGLEGSALRESISQRTDLYARVLPRGGSLRSGGDPQVSLLTLTPQSVVPLSVCLSSDGKRLQIYLRETSGKDTDVQVRGAQGKKHRIRLSDALGGKRSSFATSVRVGAHANAFIEVRL